MGNNEEEYDSLSKLLIPLFLGWVPIIFIILDLKFEIIKSTDEFFLIILIACPTITAICWFITFIMFTLEFKKDFGKKQNGIA